MTTKIELLSREDFANLFDPSLHRSLNEMIDWPDVIGMVCFECLDMTSSQLGAREGIVIGPECLFKTLDDVRGQHLNDVPSHRKYPVFAFLKGDKNVEGSTSDS